ncbi:hypothetical protein ACF3MZ_17790 [Paenibacillaceae bacterium WGS1546]|uniref:hypothetical protein n=1 Tax=Cohnella sp. WGS1546 TaxID=3366810 RepID=UPI00372D2FFC
MSSAKKIPPLGGVCTYEEAFRIGYSVDDNVNMLKRYNYVKARLVEMVTLHMNGTPEWEIKGAMSLHVWLDSEHSAWIRKRVSEMREPPLHLDKVPDERLKTFLDEALHARSSLELVVGIYGVVRPALREALERHIGETNPLVDQPTSRVLKLILGEEKEMADWGDAAIEALTDDPAAAAEAQRWKSHLGSYLEAAGGIRGDGATVGERAPERSAEPFEPQWIPQRDGRFTDIWNNVDDADRVYKDESRDPAERTWALLFKRLREMDVPEMMCSIVAQTPGKPWEYYRDMCRQIWDECRHSMMGEVGFVRHGVDWTKLPVRINWSYELNNLLTPLERHAVLYDIEFGLMPGDTGKKFEWEVTKRSGYPLAVTFHDHDWADEVLHAQIGRKWFVSRMSSHKEALELAQRAYQKIAETRKPYPVDNPDWWGAFYDSVRHLDLSGKERAAQ